MTKKNQEEDDNKCKGECEILKQQLAEAEESAREAWDYHEEILNQLWAEQEKHMQWEEEWEEEELQSAQRRLEAERVELETQALAWKERETQNMSQQTRQQLEEMKRLMHQEYENRWRSVESLAEQRFLEAKRDFFRD